MFKNFIITLTHIFEPIRFWRHCTYRSVEVQAGWHLIQSSQELKIPLEETARTLSAHNDQVLLPARQKIGSLLQ